MNSPAAVDGLFACRNARFAFSLVAAVSQATPFRNGVALAPRQLG
jgi:hypothetical protein